MQVLNEIKVERSSWIIFFLQDIYVCLYRLVTVEKRIDMTLLEPEMQMTTLQSGTTPNISYGEFLLVNPDC